MRSSNRLSLDDGKIYYSCLGAYYMMIKRFNSIICEPGGVVSDKGRENARRRRESRAGLCTETLSLTRSLEDL
jgi:hypothetical protein